MSRCSICGSHAINIDKAGLLCDVHFYKVQHDELLAALNAIVEAADSPAAQGGEMWFAEAVYTPIEDARAAITKTTGGAA